MPKGKNKLPPKIENRLPELHKRARELNALARAKREEMKKTVFDERMALRFNNVDVYADVGENTRLPSRRDKIYIEESFRKVIDLLDTAISLEGDRDIDTLHLNDLIKSFITCPTTFHIDLVWYEGTLYQINGKHTRLLMEIYPEIFAHVRFCISIYYADQTWEPTLLYQQFDVHKRSPGSTIRPSAVKKGIQIEESVTKVALTGIENVIYNTRNNLTPMERDVLLDRNKEFFDWAFLMGFLKARTLTALNLGRIPNYSGLYMIWLANREKAESYWKEIEAGGGKKTDPAREFIDFCQRTVGPRSHGDPYEQYMNAFIFCWNRWCEKKRIKRFYAGEETSILPVRYMNDETRLLLKVFDSSFSAIDMKTIEIPKNPKKTKKTQNG